MSDPPKISVRNFANINTVTLPNNDTTITPVISKIINPSKVRKQYYLNKSANKSRKFDETVVCNCGRTFSYENLYTYHKRWECGQELKCRLCQRSYCSVYYVKRHMKRCKKNTTLRLNISV